MKKLNKNCYVRLKAQADEAKELGLNKLANCINHCLKEGPRVEDNYITEEELNTEMYNYLWDITASVIDYYDLEKVDATNLDLVMKDITKLAFTKIKDALKVNNVVSSREMPLPGEYNFTTVQKIVNEFKKEFNVEASVKVTKNADSEKYYILTFAKNGIPKKYKSIDIEVI